jgi:hypothetical protein
MVISNNLMMASNHLMVISNRTLPESITFVNFTSYPEFTVNFGANDYSPLPFGFFMQGIGVRNGA